jgi:hypothetical protein
MISVDNCVAAAELLSEREEIAAPLAEIRAAQSARISWQSRKPSWTREDGTPVHTWRDGPEMPMTASLRKLLTAGIEEQLAAIDAKLRALGVEPPKELP